MQQVLINLLVNARQALEEQPQPRRVCIAAHADAMELEVGDNGPGIAEDIRARIFDPFFTTKPVGAGTGIGLGVSRGIVEAHGGTLTLAPPDGGGARFVVHLSIRAANQMTAAATSIAAKVAVPHHGRSVLIVDDESEVGRLLSEMLSTQAYRCDVVTSGMTAQKLLEQRDYDAILCDVRMPELDGPALYTWICELRPHLCGRIGFVTGETLGAAAPRLWRGAAAFLDCGNRLPGNARSRPRRRVHHRSTRRLDPDLRNIGGRDDGGHRFFRSIADGTAVLAWF
jgi:hypothetical protein